MIDLQQEKKGVMQEEMKHLHTEMEDMKEERNTQKMQWALVSGKLKQDLDSAKLFISNLKEQIEKISEERNDLKYEVQRMKDAKHKKLKEYDKLKVQVIYLATAVMSLIVIVCNSRLKILLPCLYTLKEN